eukprot:jgi/Astpho2/1316/Aster-06188
MAGSIYWGPAAVAGAEPEARSGHSFITVGGRHILFGGCGRRDGKAQAFNDLHLCDVSNPDEYKWSTVHAVNSPPPRARHTATMLDQSKMLIFGGVNHRTRYDDLWMLNLVEKSWTQVKPDGKGPAARAHHSATKCGNKIFVFGGYGGNGRAFGDFWILHLSDAGQPVRWEEPIIPGTPPTARFDHCGFIFPVQPNSTTYDKFVIMGGRDNSSVFNDSFMLDLASMTWETEGKPPTLTYELCNNLCDDIESVPYHKVFTFGGKRGPMDFQNVVEVMDCGMQFWHTPDVVGQPPCPREDSAWIFDLKTCCLVIFGGWSGRWLGDTWKANVSAIIGPPYACTGLEPDVGPVFGNTEIIVKGLRFTEGKIQVKFGTGKTEAVQDAEFVDSNTIKVKTPSYELYGAMTTDVRVNINGEGWTVNKIQFTYFANTAAKNCLAYGPGLLPTGSVFGIELPFVIQAKDTCNNKRTSGGDDFKVRVVAAGGALEGSSRIVDLHKGLYEVFFTAPAPGAFLVHVEYADAGIETPVGIRGSPFAIEVGDPWTKHRVLGSLPAKRSGLTVSAIGNELVLYGGDKSGLLVCNTADTDWKWVAPSVQGNAPVSRRLHSATVMGIDVVIFGGISMEDNSDLSDLCYLTKAAGGFTWSTPASVEGFVRQSKPDQPAALPVERSAHTAVAIDTDLLIFSGEANGELVDELCMVDTEKRATAKWQEPILKGLIPRPRKGACAAATQGHFVVMFGGKSLSAEGKEVMMDELLLWDLDGPNSVTVSLMAAVGKKPAPRVGGTFQEWAPGKLLLYGGLGGDGKPLNDAWLLDLEHNSWELQYMASSDLCPPTGMVASVVQNRMVCLNSAAGSNKLDTASSLDIPATMALYSFGPKMKVQAVEQLKALETWVERQATGLDMATNPEALRQSFDKLLKVMDSLYQTRVKKGETDLLIEQLREVLHFLTNSHKTNMHKAEKELNDVAARWEEIKKNAPQVKNDVLPVQTSEGQRIRTEVQAFIKRVADYQKSFHQRSFYKYATGAANAYPAIDQAAKEYEEMGAELQKFTGLANMFDFPEAVQPAAEGCADIRADLVMVKDVWDVSAMVEQQFTVWRSTLWSDIKTEIMEEGTKNFVKEVKSLNKKVRDDDCFKGLDNSVKNFLTSVPLVADLRSPAMRDRHWTQLMTTTKVQFTIDVNFKLDDLLRLELHKFEDEVGEIVDRAQKEEKMEQGLAKLKETWAKVEFQFVQHKGTELYTIKMAEEDFETLEDNQVLVQGMMANRYMDTFRDDILGWNKKLMNVADVNELMTKIQRTWAYLESLFIHSEEVKKELPDAARRFANIDSEVKSILKEFDECKNCVASCNREGLMKRLDKQQTELEMCEKALADYMESKRRAFPRFYFVSSADLLDILSNGNNPVKVMQHMSKCFQAVEKLKLDTETPPPGQRPKGLGMVSCVGTEYVGFKKPLPLENKVEDYMTDIITKMRSELREILQGSVTDYPSKLREKWLFDWPSQIILVVNQIYWCQEVEEAFAAQGKGNKNALAEYNKFQVKQLTKLIEVTRTELKKEDRQKVMNMITIDAHSRDMVESIVESGADRADCFQWMCQLRSYWDASVSDCRIRICDASFPYGYEYLGNGARLVVTPLTDRIYITATQACWLSMGTAPAGPAGTGKTETTKDLSAQLGKSIYVFNCAPEMDYRTMGDIFKGLAASGSWGCFDEFNRLVPEVLSVCSVQYKCVTDAQKRKTQLPGRGLEFIDKNGVKHKAIEHYTFIAADGVEMPLEEGTSGFITMNPGYIGRAELPESLKALFRPITVVVPDRQLIMENMLMAEGFVEAKMLAKKFASLYYLLEDLLSPAKHYDWGLRAIKSVLVVAGSLLRAQEGQVESDVLFRALRDFNIPKILSQDMVIFTGLLQDLFPGVNPPRKRDIEFEKVIIDTAIKMGLTPEDDFILRVVQLSELLAIRHCVFLMGPTGCGRTEVYRVLAKAIQQGTDKPVNTYLEVNNRKKVVIRDLDPKAISTQELYGYVNMATREWKDGLLSFNMRELANIPDDNPKWILLDGDLDANWIESMNSVMDDNRLLTLPSNERIRVLPHMKLIFEIRDLKFATPATATRAGILYISEGQQWNNMVQSWIQKVVRPYAEKAKWKDVEQPMTWMRELFAKYVPESIFEMKKSYSTITPLNAMNHVTTLVNILEGCLKPENLNNKSEQGMFEMTFVFAMIWAFGGALCEKDGISYRKNFDKWWKMTWTTVKIPGKGTIYDYFVNFKTGKFTPWTDLVTDIEYDSAMPMSSLFVPTAETSSLRFFLDLMVTLKKPIMFVGGAGVGKTQLVKGKLAQLPDDLASLSISFNYFTDVISFQKILESPLEKKAGINYGPPGNKQLIYFVDDLNMPKLDPYETAMPVSLIRQHLGWGHWFDRSKLTQKNINNTQYVACMNPTAGSFIINPRLQRLFMTLAVEFPGQDSLMKIYGTFLTGHLKKFSAEVQEMNTKLLQAALALHEKVAGTFRKTAVNFHYEFTVRHLANVFQGLLMSTPDQFNNVTKLSRLWLHESERVYADRLVSAADLFNYNKNAMAIAKKFFNIPDIDDYYKKNDAKPLIFCHFARGLAEKVYNEVSDYQILYKTLMEALDEYNETNAVMDLVLFEDAMKHVCRISRIISSSSGHALLVGVGGSGKQSLARLAGHICGYSTYTIVISGNYNMNNFKEELQKMYKRAGGTDLIFLVTDSHSSVVAGEGLMFLFTDSQIVDERMLVYINDLLSSGEIPDLFAQEDKDEIVNAMRSETKAMGLVRNNLHMVFTASPVGANFRVRSQRFLATINSTVIDWFQPWPESSLLSVAKKFLDDVELGSDSIRNAVVEFMPYSFAAVNAQSKRFLETEKRYNYTTPKTFLELIKLYKSVLARKREQVQNSIDRLDTGLGKLQKTQKDVDILVEEAKIKAVEVEKKVADADIFAEQVGVEKAKVNLENDAAQVEAEKCAVIAKDVTELQARCEKDLAAAEPLVAMAEAALDTLNKKDLGEAKSLKKPPAGVDDITAVILILLEGNPKDKSWGAACKVMNNVDKFLERLKGFKPLIDDNKIPKKSFDATRSYLELPHFNRDIIANKSKAAAGLCDWAINIVKYYDVVSEVEPKRQELAAANDKLLAANTRLKEVQEKVAALNAQVKQLEDQYSLALGEKNAAIAESERCQRKLGLANRLIAALASEGERWAQTVQQLRKDYQVLTGDMLLAAAFVSYAGPFTSKFRAGLIKEWIKFLMDKGAPMTPGISDPLKVLVDDATVASWVREGLPSDPTSVQNGTILTNSERWPLMMDPQLQARCYAPPERTWPALTASLAFGCAGGVVWIKERESKHNLQVVRMGAAGTVTAMERAIEAGHSVLVENMGESIDAVLNPVITRSTFKKGRSMFVKLGDKDVEYNKNFKLVLHTKLSNPHYPPEIQAETTLINFTVTESGLEDQLLALVVNKERPDLEETKTHLIIQNTEFTIKLKQLEDDLLYKLSSAEGDMTEDVALIESLEESKRVADEISLKVAEAKTTEEQINEARDKYRSVAARGAMLFFLLNGLNKIHAFYQYSLNAFVTVFSRAIDIAPGGRKQKAPKVTLEQLTRRVTGEPKDFQEVMEMARRSSQGGGRTSTAGAAASMSQPDQPEAIPEEEEVSGVPTPEQLEIRLTNLLETCTYVVFNYTRRGLFDRDKLIVLTLLTFQIMLKEQQISAEEYDALCKGMRVTTPPPITDDLSRWMNETQWAALQPLTQLPAFATLPKDIEKNSDEWERWCNNEASEKAPMPGEWSKISDFRQLLINFCEKRMGSRYVNQDAFSPPVVMSEASSSTPIFFILFPGYSPSKEIEAYAATVGKTGQEGPAEAVLDKYTKEGGWVFLDNVHLMQGWIPNLERKLEVAAETAHADFRCFFSAEPINGAPQAKIVPESILQTCIKISNEPPSDMRSNMRRAFAAFSPEMCERPSTPGKQTAFKSILFGLCFYHSLLLGRKKFGTGIGSGAGSGLGFCRGYSFNMGDLTTCGDVLFNYLEANEAVPWDDLRYMFGEVFYGGHITDDMDRRCCTTYLQVLIKPEIMPQGTEPPTLQLAPGFRAPFPKDYGSMKEYIEASLPAESPIMYGMHPNAELSLLTSQGETLFRTVIEVTGGGGSGGGGGSSEAAVRAALEDYKARLPEEINMVEVEARVREKTPYVVVALQEAVRMNTLLEEMRRSMEELLLGLDGALNMSDKMEKLAVGIATNSVPALWMAQVSTRYQEVYTLSSWYQDVLKRHEQLRAWTGGDISTPNSVWLPGLFNPKAFLTAVMQTYARQHKLPLDVMKFRTDITTKSVEQISEPAPVGCYIHGLCLEGARWDKEDSCLKDSLPNELHPALPVVQVVPVTVDQYSLQGYYACPVYTNMQRANVYSPIVSMFTLKTEDPAHKWVLASVAVLLQDELA